MEHIRILRWIFVLLSVSAFIWLAACSAQGTSVFGAGASSGAKTTITSRPPLANLEDYCSLVSASEMSRIIGATIMQIAPIINPDEAGQINCSYLGKNSGATVLFERSANSNQAQAVFEDAKTTLQGQGYTATDIRRIGDGAFEISKTGVNFVTLYIVRRSLQFYVSDIIQFPLTLDAEKQVTQLILSRL
jgi:hypothetical protein